ncbi:MAG: cation:proton antiporter [Ardenticatenaceae bacterium]|nr:cation:proton antiporter [Ardenticatenaceae bacterium]
MEKILEIAPVFIGLSILVLASRQMGDIFARFKLPLISGFLFVGILTGPFVLDFVHEQNIPQFLLLDELALAFIAFAAGAELELQVIRGYFRSIIAIISGQVVAVFALGIAAFVLIKEMVPFMASLPQREVLAIALLGATIMIARSPSSALAIIKELRARGPFTHKVLGATVLKDAVVIIIFAASVSIAAVFVEGANFNIGLLILVLFEILLDIGLGILIGLLLHTITKLPHHSLKSVLILLVGLGVFLLSTELHDFHLFSLPVGLFSEPLLICMTAGFYVANYSRLASDFQHTIEEMSPLVFLLFFTLVGIELELDVIGEAWGIILILFTVRLAGIFIGSFAGSLAAQDRSRSNALLGFGFITQAGVSVGLAKEIGVEFATWGPELATLSIGVIVLNQIVGPPLLKWAINRVGESHTRAESRAFDGLRDVIIFGLSPQSVQLARQLRQHDWQVKIATRNEMYQQELEQADIEIHLAAEWNVETLRNLDLANADSVVALLSDEENYELCELIYEHFGTETVIVRLNEWENGARLHELGVLIVEPQTAVVTLLEQYVRSPVGASLLLGMDGRQDVMDIEVRNPDLDGLTLRDLRLPFDVLVLSVSRGQNTIISHGYTRLHLGDKVTMVGAPDKLEEVMLRFDA